MKTFYLIFNTSEKKYFSRIAGKNCIVFSRLKPGDRFQPMIIGYF